jgi:hypothetical protein
MPDGVGDGCCASGHVQFDEDVAEVAVDGARADDERVGDFTIGVAFGDEAQYV